MVVSVYNYIHRKAHLYGIQKSSLKEAKLKVNRIWGEILTISDNTSIFNVPIPTHLDVTNYLKIESKGKIPKMFLIKLQNKELNFTPLFETRLHLLIVVEQKGKYKLREWLEESYEEISTYLNFPPEHWMKIKCTNVLERLNEELRRRERCIRIFPNENSCNRLMGDILQKYSEEWTSGRIYLTNPLEKIRAYREEKESGNLDPGVLEPCSASSAGLQNITDRELNEKEIDNKSEFNKQYNRSKNLKYKLKVKTVKCS